MVILYYTKALVERIDDTWFPIFIPFGILLIVFLLIAIIRGRTKD